MNIQNSKILITGGGRGIGRSLAEAFNKNGAEVGIFEIDSNAIQDLNQNQKDIKTWECDISDDQSINIAIQKMIDENFTPNILINNAGIIHNEVMLNITKSDDRLHSRKNWENVISTNLSSVFYITTRFCDLLSKKREKGVVISISSISAKGNIGQCAYSASKAGVEALMCTAAKELGPLGIRFVSIAPGFYDTVSTKEALSDFKLNKLKNSIPLRKLGNINSIYKAAQLIIECEYMTGTVIQVDGGIKI